jgi:hypothetical protein
MGQPRESTLQRELATFDQSTRLRVVHVRFWFFLQNGNDLLDELSGCIGDRVPFTADYPPKIRQAPAAKISTLSGGVV